MESTSTNWLAEVIGAMPYRLALAGGWIDQPFVSQHNPEPPGSMVVVGLEPNLRYMDRCGIGTSTRKVAIRLWGTHLPEVPPSALMKQLYEEENRGKAEPSGSQDMIGLIYPGINRLDYDYAHEGGTYPRQIESCCDPQIACWLEEVLWLVPVAPRPEGYNPLGVKNLDPDWVRRLGMTGKLCYQAILRQDLHDLGASLNECMCCWEAILPQTVSHPTLSIDLVGLLNAYQSRYAGAMYSGCGGGYLIVAAKEVVPGGLKFKVRLK
ncbi:MAG TPA: hypothetical protein VIO61_05465 [Anaerolineaceae bacterium]